MGVMNPQSIKNRKSKVRVEDIAPPPRPITSSFLDIFPNILAGKDLREIVIAIKDAKKKDKPVIFCFGGAVIKCGLSRVVCQLIRNDIITIIATNGSSLVHDTELTLFGHTSEDIEEGIK